MSVVVRFIGRGVVLIGVVILLTLLFNFLGTITCAALAGMMFGVGKQRRWQWSFVSLVFPAVIGSFLYFGESNMPLQQGILLSGICFGAFWVTFLLTIAAPYFERQYSSPPAGQAVTSKALESRRSSAQLNEKATKPPAPASAEAKSSGQPKLDELWGMWSRDLTAGEPTRYRKVIEVTQSQLTLRILALDGEARFVCRSDVKLEQIGPFKVLRLVDPQPAATTLAEGQDLPVTWIYQVVGETLSIASYFEDASVGHAPVMEVFTRQTQAEA